jgi:hypothetical protein
MSRLRYRIARIGNSVSDDGNVSGTPSGPKLERVIDSTSVCTAMQKRSHRTMDAARDRYSPANDTCEALAEYERRLFHECLVLKR